MGHELRAKILSAFPHAEVILNRRQIVEAAGGRENGEIKLLLNDGYLERVGCEYAITPIGQDRRDRYKDFASMGITHG